MRKEDLTDKAWVATQKFRTLLPMLTGFARSLSGNPTIQVKMVQRGCYSDADTIYMAPPLALGEYKRHIRSICDRRDENLQHACPACAQQEDVLYKVFHEMGHQVYGTHDKFEGVRYTAIDLRDYAVDIWKVDFPIFAGSLWKNIGRAKSKGNPSDCVMGLANAIHPWLGLVVNAVEDVRVDSRTFAARAGVRTMAEAMAWQVMAEGIEEVVDGEIVTEYWRDRSIDMQVLVGILNRGFKYDMDEFLSDEAVAVLNDPTLISLCEEIETCNDEIASFKLSCEILHRLHQLGLCEPPPEEEESEEEQEGKAEADLDGDPQDSDKSEEDNTETSKLKKLMACSVDEDTDDAPFGMSDAEAEAIAVAVVQAQWFEGPSRTVQGVRINHFKNRHLLADGKPRSCRDQDYSGWHTSYEMGFKELMPAEGILGKALTKARVVFAENQRSKLVRNQKKGRVSNKKLYRAGLEDPRLFAQKIRPDKRSYYFVVMADISGSNQSGDRMELNKKMLLAQGELLSRLGVPFEMYAHTGRMADERAGWIGDKIMLDIYPIKEAHETWSDESRKRVANLQASAANLDGHAMEFARKLCDKAQARRKIILYSSDGSMPCENYDEELRILQDELLTCKKRKYITAGIGLYTDAPTKHGLETVLVRSAADIALVVAQIEKYLD